MKKPPALPGLPLKKISTLAPCDNCPFRADVRPFLRPARLREIIDGMRRGEHFVCHKTVDYDAPPGFDVNRRICAGSLILMRKEGGLGNLQIVQLAQRLLAASFDQVKETAPVYDSAQAMLEAYAREDAAEREAGKKKR